MFPIQVFSVHCTALFHGEGFNVHGHSWSVDTPDTCLYTFSTSVAFLEHSLFPLFMSQMCVFCHDTEPQGRPGLTCLMRVFNIAKHLGRIFLHIGFDI